MSNDHLKPCHSPPSYIILCRQLHVFSYVSRAALRQSIITYVTFKVHSYCTAEKRPWPRLKTRAVEVKSWRCCSLFFFFFSGSVFQTVFWKCRSIDLASPFKPLWKSCEGPTSHDVSAGWFLAPRLRQQLSPQLRLWSAAVMAAPALGFYCWAAVKMGLYLTGNKNNIIIASSPPPLKSAPDCCCSTWVFEPDRAEQLMLLSHFPAEEGKLLCAQLNLCVRRACTSMILWHHKERGSQSQFSRHLHKCDVGTWSLW